MMKLVRTRRRVEGSTCVVKTDVPVYIKSLTRIYMRTRLCSYTIVCVVRYIYTSIDTYLLYIYRSLVKWPIFHSFTKIS